MRPALCEEALRLGRIVAELAPSEAEVHGLVALMEIQASRAKARIGLRGEPVLLLDQNRAQWDQLLIHRGLAALERIKTVIAVPGPYVLQAEIAACHARARTPEETDWRRIVELYGTLAKVAPSPVIKLDRARAMAMAFGPAARAALNEQITGSVKARRALRSYMKGNLRLGANRERSLATTWTNNRVNPQSPRPGLAYRRFLRGLPCRLCRLPATNQIRRFLIWRSPHEVFSLES
jgi:predicted RNA polymerase sigma factor